MALFGLSREEKAYQAFFKKTGIQIHDEPEREDNEELDNEMEELFYKSRSNPRKAIPRLEKLIKKHPHIPSLKNYLYAACSLSGQSNKASRVLEDTLEKHPKYIFGITNKILNIKDREELKKHEYLLGKSKDIREIIGYDKPIHISPFKNYQAAVAHFETFMDNEPAAIERLETLIDLKVEKEFLDEVAQRIAIYRIKKMGENIGKMNEGRITSNSKQTIFLENMDVPPKLNHTELEVFYQKSLSDFSEEDFKSIASLPKETFILDLENILEDSIRRWEEFQLDDYDESQYEFMIHALFWIGDLKPKESLEKVLNLLRMDEEFISYWMADWYEDYFYPTLYYLGESQLDRLKDFILEDHIYSFYRLRASEVVAQVAMHQPHRREEVVQWFQSVFDFLLKNPNNKSLIDTSFIGFLIGDVIDFRGTELLNTIEELNQRGWIHKSIQGDFEEIKKLIQKPFHKSELKPLPLNIREFYNQEYKERKAARPPLSKEDQQLLSQLTNPSKGGELVFKKYTEMFSSAFSKRQPFDDDIEDLPFLDYKEEEDTAETFVRTGKKVGRNDPCPCGSGKKYKKCCLNK